MIWPIDLDSHLLVPDYHVAEHQVIWRVHSHLLLELEAMLGRVLVQLQEDVILSGVLGFRRVRLSEPPEILTDGILDYLRFLIQGRVC